VKEPGCELIIIQDRVCVWNVGTNMHIWEECVYVYMCLEAGWGLIAPLAVCSRENSSYVHCQF
jgi:hypothetical protein